MIISCCRRCIVGNGNRIQRNILYYYDVFFFPGTHHCLHNKENIKKKLQSCLVTDAAR